MLKPGTNDHPVLNEETFQQLLSAAYVMQEHNARGKPKSNSQHDYSYTLTAITETHERIRNQHLDLVESVKLIAQRTQEFTKASGSAIGLIDGDQILYRAGSGSGVKQISLRLPLQACLGAECLRSGQVLQSHDALNDARLPRPLCQKLEAKSLLAAPIVHAGKIVGVVELYYDKANALNEFDLRTSQLMAGLVSEALIRHRTAEAEQAAMLQELEALHPQPPAEAPKPAPLPAPPATSGEVCAKCGHTLRGNESFCGSCGNPRANIVSSEPPPKQKAWTSLWEMNRGEAAAAAPPTEQKIAAASDTPPASRAIDEEEDLFPAELEEIVAQFAQAGDEDFPPPAKPAAQAEPIDDSVILDDEPAILDGALTEELIASGQPSQEAEVAVVPRSTAPWGSAAKTLEWLESIRAQRSTQELLSDIWKKHRGSISLAIAAAFLLVVILDWMMRPVAVTTPNGVQPAATNTDRPVQELSAIDRLLINLGLAEAPPPPKEYRGNPDTIVWVDTHTALYYCPGADLYGKTTDGKSTTQLDAQRDQFAPATRRPCD